MDTRELRTFVTVSETLNYQKAAEMLQYAPSTLFKHIQQLERELDTQLVVRDGRALRLTAAGERFLPIAQDMLAGYRAAMSLKEQKPEPLTIGGCEMNIGNSLIDLLTRFADSHPQIRLNMITAPNAGIPGMVREGQVDMGFFYSTGQKNHHLQAIHLYREPAFLVASRRNPLSGVRGLHYEDLRGMELVYPHDSCCFVNMLISELGRRRIELKKVSFLGGMQLVVNQVRRKDTVTLAPQCALRRFEETYGLVRLDMQEKPLSAWETILLGSRAEKEAVQELLDFSMREARRIVREYRLETEERAEASGG